MPNTLSYWKKQAGKNWRQRSYAWAKYYEEVEQDHAYDIVVYNTLTTTTEPEIMNVVPTHIANELKELLAKTKTRIECPICIEVIPVENLELSSCGHKYCKTCYYQYLDHLVANEEPLKCAVCKRKVRDPR